MNPKIISSLLLIICALTQAKSQNCAVSDKTDPFTHQRNIETGEIKLYSTSILASGLSSSYYIAFSLRNGEFNICMDAELEIKLSPDYSEFVEVILLFSDNSTVSLKDFNSPGGYKELLSPFTNNKSYCKVDRLTTSKFIESKLTKVRFVTHDGAPIDVNIKPSKSNDISKLAQCILSYKGPSDWKSYKISDKLSVKLPTPPQRVNDSGIKATDDENVIYGVSRMDIAKKEGIDSATLVARLAKPEFLSSLKSKFAQPGIELGDIKPGTWKTYTCYHLEGTYPKGRLSIYYFMVLVGTNLFQFYSFIPEGKSNGGKDKFFASVELN